MRKSRFDELLEDRSVAKINTIGGGIFKDQKDEVAIQFLFMHAGDLACHTLPPKKRIFLSAFPYKNLIKEIQAYPIRDNIIILANADTFEYSLTYLLSIDSAERTIKVKILDEPNVGDRFITQEEVNGITVSY